MKYHIKSNVEERDIMKFLIRSSSLVSVHLFHLPQRLKEWLVSSIRSSQVPLQISSLILELLPMLRLTSITFSLPLSSSSLALVPVAYQITALLQFLQSLQLCNPLQNWGFSSLQHFPSQWIPLGS